MSGIVSLKLWISHLLIIFICKNEMKQLGQTTNVSDQIQFLDFAFLCWIRDIIVKNGIKTARCGERLYKLSVQFLFNLLYMLGWSVILRILNILVWRQLLISYQMLQWQWRGCHKWRGWHRELFKMWKEINHWCFLSNWADFLIWCLSRHVVTCWQERWRVREGRSTYRMKFWTYWFQWG